MDTIKKLPEMTTDELSNHLRKYIEENGCAYELIIHKNDWDGYEDRSWLAYYMKIDKNAFSDENILLRASGATLNKVLRNMLAVYEEYNKKK